MRKIEFTLTNNQANKARIVNTLEGTGGMFQADILKHLVKDAVFTPEQISKNAERMYKMEVKRSLVELISTGELKATLIDGRSFIELT